MGSAVLQTVTNEIQSIFASISGSSSLGNALNIGISLSGGQIQFNQSTFQTAFAANPAQVAAMFTQDGTFTPASPAYTGEVSLSFAGNTTKAGTYDVQISQSATQATDTGATLASGSVSAAEQLTVSMGTTSAEYSTTSGESLTRRGRRHERRLRRRRHVGVGPGHRTAASSWSSPPTTTGASRPSR